MTVTLDPPLAPPPAAPEPGELRGRAVPRLFTAPLVTGPPGPCSCGCALTPATSLGFEAELFATQVLGVSLLGWQRWWLIHALELRPDGRYRFRTIVTLVARQQGKALDTATPMLTTRGWSTMGELCAGDEVYGPDGRPVRVLGAYDVMHGRPCYRVTTTDGRSIVADADHLWTVQDRRNVTRTGRRGERRTSTYQWETLTTAQLMERGLTRAVRQNASGGTSTDYAFRLPQQHAADSPDVELPVDPYLLGAWLGDGASEAAHLTVGDQDLDETVTLIQAAGARIVSTTRHRTAWRVAFSVDDRRRKVCTFRSALTELGVWGAKRVPDPYLAAGTAQRLALLQGLMDTDGSIYATGASGSVRAEFTATRRELAEGVLYLVRSLGWRATMRENAATVGGREVGRRWRVTWTPQAGDSVPFRLARKAARVQAARSRAGERHAVSIASIEPVESRPVRCIRVDREDGLYLAGRDLVVTHNTTLLKLVALWAMFTGRVQMVLGAAQSLDIARESWWGAVQLAREVPELAAELDRVLNGNNDRSMLLANGARYRVAAATEGAGRGLSVDLLILDELRQHHDWSAWGALSKTTLARPNALTVGISNAGEAKSVVLNSLRAAALAGADESLGLMEWSAPEGCALDDPEGWCQAMPGLGVTITEQAVRGYLATDPPAVFRTELLCQLVDALDGAIDQAGWADCADPGSDLGTADRSRVCLCLDVAPDGAHVTLAGAAVLADGRVRVEVIDAWDNTVAAREALPDLLAAIGPADFGWFPSGPAATLGAELRAYRRTVNLAAARIERGPDGRRRVVDSEDHEAQRLGVQMDREACQGFSDLVRTRRLLHAGQALLDTQAAAAGKDSQGRFVRTGGAHVDALYACAGATYLARLLPEPVPVPRSRAF